MRCIGCGSAAVTERPERTAQGYRRFRCRSCSKQFNERTGTVLNRAQYPSDVIALVVLWRLRYKLSLRDLPEMFLVRGMVFCHETVREWEAKLTPALAEELRRRRRGKAGRSWYVDETYIKVDGRWCYLYRAIDRSGTLVDVMFSEHRDMAAAKAFFRSAKAVTGVTPDRVTTDGHGSYPRAIKTELGKGVRHRTSRYLNNRLEIGQSQMTKADLLARPVRRHHVADLDLAVGDDHPVDQEFDQGSPLLEGGLIQALPHPPAELPDGGGQSRELLLPVRLRFELPRLFLELLLTSFEVSSAPPVLVERHHAGEIGVRQALELLPQTGLPAA